MSGLDTQTTVTMLCLLALLNVLDKKKTKIKKYCRNERRR